MKKNKTHDIGGGGFGPVTFTPETHDGFDLLYKRIEAEKVETPESPKESVDEPDPSNDAS